MKKSLRTILAIGVILLLAFTIGAGVYQHHKADNTSGVESAIAENTGDQLDLISLALVLVPAITLVKLTTSLGFKSLVARQDENGNTAYITYLQDFLRGYLIGYGNPQTKDAISGGKVFFDPITYYIRFVVTGLSGKQKILGETTTRTVGATNFNLGYLPKFTNFAWNKIGISYAVDATSASVAAKDIVGFTNVRASVDKSIANGEIIISSARNVVFENPIAPFLIGALGTAGAIAELDYEVDQPRVLKENELVEMELNLANTVPSVAATTYAVEVRLTGVQCRLRG